MASMLLASCATRYELPPPVPLASVFEPYSVGSVTLDEYCEEVFIPGSPDGSNTIEERCQIRIDFVDKGLLLEDRQSVYIYDPQGDKIIWEVSRGDLPVGYIPGQVDLTGKYLLLDTYGYRDDIMVDLRDGKVVEMTSATASYTPVPSRLTSEWLRTLSRRQDADDFEIAGPHGSKLFGTWANGEDVWIGPVAITSDGSKAIWVMGRPEAFRMASFRGQAIEWSREIALAAPHSIESLIGAMAVTPDDRVLALRDKGQMRLFDMRTGTALSEPVECRSLRLAGRRFAVDCLSYFQSDYRMLGDGVQQAVNNQQPWVIQKSTASEAGITATVEYRTVDADHDARRLMLYETRTGSVLSSVPLEQRLPEGLGAVDIALSADGSLLAVNDTSGVVFVLDVSRVVGEE
uniref:Uncharacterized protein n=1 Tax=Aquisalinus luteolus TaxID=1566827 RepID=A0A8J3EQ27_9PROT|nr:hypothetical protein GCM10011355_04570 [Aquisalinus luteolus]